MLHRFVAIIHDQSHDGGMKPVDWVISYLMLLKSQLFLMRLAVHVHKVVTIKEPGYYIRLIISSNVNVAAIMNFI